MLHSSGIQMRSGFKRMKNTNSNESENKKWTHLLFLNVSLGYCVYEIFHMLISLLQLQKQFFCKNSYVAKIILCMRKPHSTHK